ncbi:MAG: nuclear transport factor 2 family protein [Oscillospiraceae bacterium]|nr:nuclear transport factor 2 family protein [Oscillospiraceae bacterium]
MTEREYETAMWEAAKNRDKESFSELVDENAVMVCGGYRCTGAEYADIVKEFDISSYKMTGFEVIFRTDDMFQVHYLIETKASREENKDLEGVFHITSTWKSGGDKWKVIFKAPPHNAANKFSQINLNA